MEGGAEMYGMQTFEMAIKALAQRGIIEREAARAALGF
jgi:Tfp pilus assembly pilus retraction ATPase PilT